MYLIHVYSRNVYQNIDILNMLPGNIIVRTTRMNIIGTKAIENTLFYFVFTPFDNMQSIFSSIFFLSGIVNNFLRWPQ